MPPFLSCCPLLMAFRFDYFRRYWWCFRWFLWFSVCSYSAAAFRRFLFFRLLLSSRLRRWCRLLPLLCMIISSADAATPFRQYLMFSFDAFAIFIFFAADAAFSLIFLLLLIFRFFIDWFLLRQRRFFRLAPLIFHYLFSFDIFLLRHWLLIFICHYASPYFLLPLFHYYFFSLSSRCFTITLFSFCQRHWLFRFMLLLSLMMLMPCHFSRYAMPLIHCRFISPCYIDIFVMPLCFRFLLSICPWCWLCFSPLRCCLIYASLLHAFRWCYAIAFFAYAQACFSLALDDFLQISFRWCHATLIDYTMLLRAADSSSLHFFRLITRLCYFLRFDTLISHWLLSRLFSSYFSMIWYDFIFRFLCAIFDLFYFLDYLLLLFLFLCHFFISSLAFSSIFFRLISWLFQLFRRCFCCWLFLLRFSDFQPLFSDAFIFMFAFDDAAFRRFYYCHFRYAFADAAEYITPILFHAALADIAAMMPHFYAIYFDAAIAKILICWCLFIFCWLPLSYAISCRCHCRLHWYAITCLDFLHIDVVMMPMPPFSSMLIFSLPPIFWCHFRFILLLMISSFSPFMIRWLMLIATLLPPFFADFSPIIAFFFSLFLFSWLLRFLRLITTLSMLPGFFAHFFSFDDFADAAFIDIIFITAIIWLIIFFFFFFISFALRHFSRRFIFFWCFVSMLPSLLHYALLSISPYFLLPLFLISSFSSDYFWCSLSFVDASLLITAFWFHFDFLISITLIFDLLIFRLIDVADFLAASADCHFAFFAFRWFCYADICCLSFTSSPMLYIDFVDCRHSRFFSRFLPFPSSRHMRYHFAWFLRRLPLFFFFFSFSIAWCYRCYHWCIAVYHFFDSWCHASAAAISWFFYLFMRLY